MGYESKIYIIRKTDLPLESGFKYAETVAVFNMGVFPPFQKLFSDNGRKTEHAPCSEDSDIISDKYGDPLKEALIEEVLDCLDEAIDLGDDKKYPRVTPLKAMLEGFEEIRNGWYQNLAVLHYGY